MTSTYRLRTGRRGGTVVESWDGAVGTCVAYCEVRGKAVFAHLEVHGADDSTPVWRARPNRRVAPNRWNLTCPGQPSITMSHRIGLKPANPWTRHLLTLERHGENEPFHVVDATANGFGRQGRSGRVGWCLDLLVYDLVPSVTGFGPRYHSGHVC